MQSSVLETNDLSLSVGGRILAQGINMAVGPGETHAIMGPSGAGKSTLLWTLIGLMRNGGGSITIGGERVSARHGRSAASIRRRFVGIVYQQPNLLSELSVVENISVPLMMARALSPDAAEQEAINSLRGLGVDLSVAVANLSGGEQQRVSIARASVASPAIIVADEPTAALDEHNAGLVVNCLLDQCNDYGSALLMVTHDSRVAARADTCWNLSEGRLLRVRG